MWDLPILLDHQATASSDLLAVTNLTSVPSLHNITFETRVTWYMTEVLCETWHSHYTVLFCPTRLSTSFTLCSVYRIFIDFLWHFNSTASMFSRNSVNSLMGTLKPQSNGPSYSNYSDCSTFAVDGWAVTFGTAKRSLRGLQPAQSPPRCTKCNSPPINGQCTNFILFDVAL